MFKKKPILVDLCVENIDETWQYLQSNGGTPGPIKEHVWGAPVFYFFDPEGHRIEVWSLVSDKHETDVRD